MDILIYGGCHAAALTRLFNRYGLEGVTATNLTNFTLIAKGEPFPYEDMLKYDLVIFSPIMNKKAYNTSHLEDFLEGHKIQFLKYPWIQWNGYFPGFKHTTFDDHRIWWNDILTKEAPLYKTFEDFEAEVVEGNILSDMALQNVEASTSRLRKTEIDGNVDVHIADWIVENYMDRRLLLTPDHACVDLYKHLFRQIEALVGKVVEPSLYFSTTEIQEGLITPILPSVARSLGLKFSSGDFRDPRIASGKLMSLREYLRVYYETDDIFELCVSTKVTRMKFSDADIPVKEGEKIIAARRPSTRTGHDCYRLISSLKEGSRNNSRFFGKEFFAYRSHWDGRQVLS